MVKLVRWSLIGACRTLALCLKCVKSQFREKNPVLLIEDVLSLEVPGNAKPYYSILLYYLSSCRLREVKNKRKFQTLTALEVVAPSLAGGSKYWYSGKLAAEGKWSHTGVCGNRRFDCID